MISEAVALTMLLGTVTGKQKVNDNVAKTKKKKKAIVISVPENSINTANSCLVMNI